MDVVDRGTRSRMMSGIRGKNTKPERTVRSFLHRAGFRFRLHANLPGRPDVTLPRFRAVVFVHGCFWHRHPDCRYSTTPASNIAFWQAKFAENRKRDALVKQQLRRLGWRVHVVWSCEVNQRKMDALIARLRSDERKVR
ncbi:MAG: DNA mismatch endonuclease Vsr [Gammaproteobacteria bacterium]|nr:MAG: DNA mismatch endonuclease Vsr [Gammaproteobacteria bacterium]